MVACGKMGSRKSTCLYLDQGVVETARQMGLNLSRVSENALIRAIEKLADRRPETGLNSQAEIEGRDRDSNPGGETLLSCVLDAFEFEYDRSESVDATVDGDTFLLEPWEVPTKAQESDVTVYGGPSGSAEPFGHPWPIKNEFLTILKNPTSFKMLLDRRHRPPFENFRRAAALQNCYLNLLMWLTHFNHANSYEEGCI
jgi:post-segregation antitoxin (ccd killing protein)